jgi:hypothetical protein
VRCQPVDIAHLVVLLGGRNWQLQFFIHCSSKGVPQCCRDERLDMDASRFFCRARSVSSASQYRHSASIVSAWCTCANCDATRSH